LREYLLFHQKYFFFNLMKKRHIASLVSVFFAVTAAAESAPADSVTLTLDDCVRIALSESPTIKVADLDVTRVDYSKKEVLGQLLPSISFDATYNRMLAKQVAYMNMDAFSGLGGSSSDDGSTGDDDSESSSSSSSMSNGIKMGLDNSFQLGFTASMPLIAPQLWQSLKLSDSQIAQSVEQARASRLDLVNQVKNAYYALLLANDSKKVIQESYDMAALTYDIYSKQNSVGAASEYDVLRASVAMKNVEPELLQADISIKKARLQLLILMGVSADTPFKFSGELSDYEKTMYADVLALGNDYSNNSSLVLQRLQTNTLSRALKVQKMSLIPTLSLATNYNWTSSSNGNPLRNFRWNPYSYVALSLSVPLYQGGQRMARIRQAEIQVEQADWQQQNLERSVNMQVTLAQDNIKLNVKQIASCSESVMQAQRAYDIMRQSFDIGAASYLELRDSQLALTQSRLTRYQAIYNYLLAGAELELLLGNAVPVQQTDNK
jgi:outer membrane protein TolC